MDPPGFALESFDVTGGFRTHYRALPASAANKRVRVPGKDQRFYVEGLPVDPSYVLADGRPFADVDEFRKLALSDRELIAKNVTKKLIAHLTGAMRQFADREAIAAIVKETESSDYGIRDLVHAVVQSELFRRK